MIDAIDLSQIRDQALVVNIREITTCFVQQLTPLKVILFGSFADGSYTDDIETVVLMSRVSK